MLVGLGKSIGFDVKPKLTYKQMKEMNKSDKEEIMNLILAKDKKMQ